MVDVGVCNVRDMQARVRYNQRVKIMLTGCG